jgi:hypothetical protein
MERAWSDRIGHASWALVTFTLSKILAARLGEAVEKTASGGRGSLGC